ncbi:MAG: hypothetical protein OXT67_10600 [Zetaproteobacteria bacterium]|nr:hypothetical protein [Zetaproteobacteria bacterium]
MHTKKVTRRHFTRYVSHSLIGAALSRTFIETRAFGAEGRLKIMLCTTPNGHMDFASTKSALMSGLSSTAGQGQALFIKGLMNSCYNSDWHGSEGGLFGLHAVKQGKPSFYTTTISNTEQVVLAVSRGQNPAYPRDSSGGATKAFTTPEGVLKRKLGLFLGGINTFNLAEVKKGKQHVLDQSLADIRKIRQQLGSDGRIFDDHLYALQALYREHVPTESNGSEQEGGGGATTPVQKPKAPSMECNTNASIPAGSDDESKHTAMLEVAFHLFACDMAQVVVVSMLDSQGEPYHQAIHGDSTGTGARFRALLEPMQQRIAKLADRLAQTSGNVLERSAVVYISEGSAHIEGGGRFNPQHPHAEIPLAVFGKLGGVIRKSGDLTAQGDQRRLWRVLADGLAGGRADLSSISDGSNISPLEV